MLGGLSTDPQMRVCDKEDNPIPGLYNVGTMVGDMFATNYTFMVEGANYGANCITFGYLTGKHIAENEVTPDRDPPLPGKGRVPPRAPPFSREATTNHTSEEVPRPPQDRP